MIAKDTTHREFFVELHQLEEENRKLRRENSRLSAENRQLQQILNASDCGIFIRDTNQRLVYVNETFCQHIRSNKTKLLQNTPSKLGKVAKRYFKDDKEVKRSGT
ncbi:MAG: PAS domain-containing protein, partial [Cyclobacteriaceae bacterium]